MKLYLKYFSMHLKCLAQYKASFVLLTIGQFLTAFSAFLGIFFLMNRFHTVKGFTFSEVLLFFAVTLLSFALAECFARGFDTFSSMLGNGEFDRILLRPRNTVFQVIASKIELSRAGRLIQAALTLGIAVGTGEIHWSLAKGLLLVEMILCGAVFFASLFVLGAAICFFTTEGLEILNIFTDGGREFGRYPLSVYGKDMLRFYTFVVPMALFQYYPMLLILDRSQNSLLFFSPVLSLLFLLPVAVVWKLGVRHYRSCGS